MNPLSVHLICVGLVMADLLARAWRIQWLVRGVGYRVSFGQAFTVNALGDAACALSPLRIAGEPARLATLLRAGVPATGAFVAITYEVLAAWPVIIVGAGILAWLYAPEWWASTAPQIGKVVRDFWPVAVLAAILTLAVWLWVRRAAPAASTHFKRPLRRILVHWRRMPRWPVMASIPMTVTNLVSRVAILPVLASTLPHPPSLGPMLVGSFALLYSQMILPTPSGAGAVDLIFVAGAAGDLGSDEGRLLLLWRLYTAGIGIALGLLLGIHTFGWQAIKTLLRPAKPGVKS